MSQEPEPGEAAALEAVRTFLDMARRHVDDDSLAIALVSTGAALIASTRGAEEAIDALRSAIKEVRKTYRSH